MEDGKTFYGMSSENEYWYSSTETLADDSSVETLSGKDNRDASCNVDFDEELDEIIDDGTSAVVRSSRRSVNPTRSTISDCVECKSSQYVRWDVLMSLGVGLWAVLCIVDVLHSDKSVTIGENINCDTSLICSTVLTSGSSISQGGCTNLRKKRKIYQKL